MVIMYTGEYLDPKLKSVHSPSWYFVSTPTPKASAHGSDPNISNTYNYLVWFSCFMWEEGRPAYLNRTFYIGVRCKYATITARFRAVILAASSISRVYGLLWVHGRHKDKIWSHAWCLYPNHSHRARGYELIIIYKCFVLIYLIFPTVTNLYSQFCLRRQG